MQVPEPFPEASGMDSPDDIAEVPVDSELDANTIAAAEDSFAALLPSVAKDTTKGDDEEEHTTVMTIAMTEALVPPPTSSLSAETGAWVDALTRTIIIRNLIQTGLLTRRGAASGGLLK